jgi:ABC-type Zn uptake system ZnuABC Zn-binding protein ZnuA
MGDVHPFGNPHYLSDPANGLRVAALIRDALIALRPESAAQFQARYAAFATALVEALVGPRAAAGLGVGRVARAALTGRLAAVLEPLGAGELGGWLGSFRASPGTKAVQDHRLWPYFAQRFGFVLADTLEPRPGIPPTTRHLTAVVERMQAQNIGLVLVSPYADPRPSRWVAERTGGRVAAMAHQVGARKGTDDYLALIDYNVAELLGRR